MKQIASGAALVAIIAAGPAAAHHSYAAYQMDRVIDVDGVVEVFEWVAPHSLLKVRAEGKVYLFEWRAPNGLARSGVRRDALAAGDRVVAGGNPRRDIAESGVVNLTHVRRVTDGWSWARPQPN